MGNILALKEEGMAIVSLFGSNWDNNSNQSDCRDDNGMASELPLPSLAFLYLEELLTA